LLVLQYTTGDFGGLERAFATTVSSIDGAIEMWELSASNRFDSNRFDTSARITWYAEFPSFTWGDFFKLKKLVSAELWVDRVYGEVVFTMEYRPDGQTCWIPWKTWKICSAKNSCEDLRNPVCYPIVPFGESYRATQTLPEPPSSCASATGRPTNIGYQFQPRLTVKGFCRIRGLLLHAIPVDRALYQGLVCGTDAVPNCPPLPSVPPAINPV
jgi:hypothetical protein